VHGAKEKYPSIDDYYYDVNKDGLADLVEYIELPSYLGEDPRYYVARYAVYFGMKDGSFKLAYRGKVADYQGYMRSREGPEYFSLYYGSGTRSLDSQWTTDSISYDSRKKKWVDWTVDEWEDKVCESSDGISECRLNLSLYDDGLNDQGAGARAIEKKQLSLKEYHDTYSRFVRFNPDDEGSRLKDLIKKFPITPDNVHLYDDIAVFVQRVRDFEASVDVLKKILEKFPDRYQSWFNLGNAYWGMRREKEAKEAYQEYIRLAQKFSKAVSNKAIERIQGKLPEQILPSQRKSLRLTDGYHYDFNGDGIADKIEWVLYPMTSKEVQQKNTLKIFLGQKDGRFEEAYQEDFYGTYYLGEYQDAKHIVISHVLGKKSLEKIIMAYNKDKKQWYRQKTMKVSSSRDISVGKNL
jgi:tetratricopeptide (TPR) repeat protein